MNKLYNDTAVQAIANAIRAKNGSSDTYTIAEMSTALNDISYYAKPIISNVPIATFEADGLPLNSLKVSVEAKQAGSGTPSPENVRPISGWDNAVVSDEGKNLFDKTSQGIKVGYALDPNDGSSYVSSSGNWDVTGFIEIEGGSNYTLSGSNADVAFFDEYKIYIEGWSSFGTRTAPQNAKYIKFDFLHVNVDSVQLELGETATSYEPYINQTTTITLGQTVYGGELDVVNGELKITDGYIASYNGETLPSTWISSMDVYAEGTSPTTGAEVCYKLANSTTISLTPTLIKSLNGINNLSVDCGEVIELEYFKEV